jgi:hypothetical protein
MTTCRKRFVFKEFYNAKRLLTLLLFFCYFFISAIPVFASTFIVSNNSNTGNGSLRQAITDANSNPGADIINFNISGTGPFTIILSNALPNISGQTTLDGLTQPGTSIGNLKISITGSNFDGLILDGGSSNSIIRGLNINGFGSGNGIVVQNSSNNNTIESCYIGVNLAGTLASANYNGIKITATSTGTIIGGTLSGKGNVISGNGNHGIYIENSSNNTVIKGNYIGINATGTLALPNSQCGIRQTNTTIGITIGGPSVYERNIISGNSQQGIFLDNGANNSIIKGNFIGVGSDGITKVANGSDGIKLLNSADALVGGTITGEGNVISGNMGHGINLDNGSDRTNVKGNFLGVNKNGNSSPNAVGNNQCGIRTYNSSTLVIGTNSSSARNIVSGNSQDGIRVEGGAASTIKGNYIGVDVNGSTAIANANNGIQINNVPNNSACSIGGNGAGDGNVISGNTQNGIWFTNNANDNAVFGNYIGTDYSGIYAIGNGQNGIKIETYRVKIGGINAGEPNTIGNNGANSILVTASFNGNQVRKNSIFCNTAKGINMSGSANNVSYRVSPSINSASTTTNLYGATSANETVDIYSNHACGASCPVQGQGLTYIATVIANASGVWAYTGGVSGTVVVSSMDNQNNSSEFSSCNSFCSSPSISLQPGNATICSGGNTSFTVTAAGTSLSYQWQASTDGGVTYSNLTNTGIYSGVTTTTLTLTAVPSAFNTYKYRSVITNSCGSLNSNAGVLTINTAPSITIQPSNSTICTGANTTFSVTATGANLTYQWQVNTGLGFSNISNSTLYSNATTATLNITAATASMNSYTYQCVISGTCSPIAITSIATLAINRSPSITSQPSNATICSGGNTSFTTVANGIGLTYQWQVNSGTGFVNIINGALYSNVTTASMGITAATSSMNTYAYQCVISGTCSPIATTSSVSLTVNSPPSITAQPSNSSTCAGANTSFSVTATGANLTYQWQVNTGLGFSNIINSTLYSNATTATLNITAATASMNTYTYQCVIAGTCSPIATTSIATLTINPSPSITTQPSNATICSSGNTSFTTGANGPGLTYQWQVNSGTGYINIINGTFYTNATTATLNITGATSALNGYSYQCLISGMCNPVVTTSSGILTVNQSPSITTQPLNATICSGANTSFTIAASGTGISYQWQVNSGTGFVNIINGAPYSNATTATLNITGGTSALNGYTYLCVVSGTCTPTSSNSATLTINTPPVITVQPSNSAICSGTNSSFSVTATGANLTYQWQVNTGSAFSNITNNTLYSNATTSTLNIAAATANMNTYTYQCVILGACGPSITSSVASLTVSLVPSITTQPTNATICSGSNTSFTIAASGTALTYQWQVNSGTGYVNITNGSLYSNSTTATLNITGATSALNGYTYQCVATGTCAPAAISNTVTLTINTSPIITTQPSNASICSGANTAFSVIASGTNLSYQWQINTGLGFVNIANNTVYSNASTSTLNITSANQSMNGYLYQCVASGSCLPAVSSTSASLTISNCGAFTCVVDTTADFDNNKIYTPGDHSNTLRKCIRLTNATTYHDTINFNIAGNGVKTIVLGTTLPSILSPLHINGLSQRGAFAGNLKIAITGNSSAGLSLADGSSNSVIKGVIIQGLSGAGIVVQNSSNNDAIESCYIGVDSTGNKASPNQIGINVYNSATNITIGGSDVSKRNIVSGNTGFGIAISNGSSTNTIQNNYIGIGRDGISVIGNSSDGVSVLNASAVVTNNVVSCNGGNGLNFENNTSVTLNGNKIGTDIYGTISKGNFLCGVRMLASHNVTVGGSAISDRNVISGNKQDGIKIDGGAQFITIQGNCIGTDSSGKRAIGNGGNGINLPNAQHVTIGGSTGTTRNFISGNIYHGIYFQGPSTDNTVYGNFIGTDTDFNPVPNSLYGVKIEGPRNAIGGGGPGQGNKIANNGGGGVYVGTVNGVPITNNSIFCNVGKGIYLYGNANNVQNRIAPTINVSSTTTNLTGNTSSNEMVEIYKNHSCSVSCADQGQGYTYIATVQANGSGVWTYTGGATGNIVCASMDNQNNSSEFSKCLVLCTNPAIASQPSNATICNGANTTFTITASGTDLKYQWQVSTDAGVNYTNIVNSATYGGATLASLSLTSPATSSTYFKYRCSISNPCGTLLSSAATLIVNSPPVITAQTSNVTICEGANTSFYVTATGTNLTYQWQFSTDGVAYSNVVDGGVYSGSLNSILNLTASPKTLNNYKYRCVINGVCQPTLTSIVATLTVNPGNPVSVNISASASTVCAGMNVVFNATITNGGLGPVYQWKLNGLNTGANSATYSTTSLANNDVVTCTLTSNASCALGNPAVSNALTTQVKSNIVITTSPLSKTICTGATTSFSIVANRTDVTYQWQEKLGVADFVYLNDAGIFSGSSSSTLTVDIASDQMNGNQYRCVVSGGCMAPVVSSAASLTVSPFTSPGLSISTTSNTACAGALVQFTAVPVNGGSSPIYQWMVNGVNAGTNNAVFSSTSLLNNDVVTCSIVSNANCIKTTTAKSNAITMMINGNVSVSVNITASQTAICGGANVLFSAIAINGGTSPIYNWKLNGLAVGTNSNTYSNNSLSNNDTILCRLTSNIGCALGNPASSNPIKMSVNTGVAIVSSPANATVCSGNVASFFIAANGTPTYQWQEKIGPADFSTITNAGIYSGATTGTLTISGTPVSMNANQYRCLLNGTCPSIAGTLTVNPRLPVSVSIVASQSTICTGATVVFTATPTNGGANPSYKWKLNGTVVDSSGPTYSNNHLSNNDNITCVLNSNANCISGSPALSNTVLIIINATVTPSVSIVASQANICSGTNVQFTASPTNGGTAPIYQWKKNGINVGTNSPTYSNNALANNDSIKCVLVSNATCISTANVSSNTVTISINPQVVASISIVASKSTICAGERVTFTASTTNAGTSPSYVWKLNGKIVGFNNPVYYNTGLMNKDTIICVLTASSCAPVVSSNSVGMVVNNGPSVTAEPLNKMICENGTTFFTVVATGTGLTYQWQEKTKAGSFVNAIESAKYNGTQTTTLTINTIPLAMDSNQYRVLIGGTCNSAAPSVAAMLNISKGTPAGISIASSQNNICTGATVVFTATTLNSGTNPSYQWKLNGVNVGSNSSIYSNSNLANNDTVRCLLTSNASCVTGSPVLSGPVKMTVNSTTLLTSNPVNSTVCAGANTNFTVNASGTGITYQWQEKIGSGAFMSIVNGGIYTGATSAVLSLTAVPIGMNTNQYQCVLGGNCPSGTATLAVEPVGNANITIAVVQPMLCSGAIVSFMATTTNGGSNPTYQWKLNGLKTGTNSAVYSNSNLTDNDIVTCTLLSSSLCATNPSSISNPITILFNKAPVVTGHPFNSVICEGGSTTFNLTATGTGLSYQWQEKTSTGVFTNLSNTSYYSGVNTAALTLTGVTPALNNNLYKCVVTGSCSPATSSNIVTLNVNSNVVASIAISGPTAVCAGTSTLFYASTNAKGKTTYQWKVNGINVGTNSYTFTSSSLVNGDVITCQFTTDACGVAGPLLSNSLTMVVSNSPAIASAPVNIKVCAGANANFSVSSTGSNLVYRWQQKTKTAGFADIVDGTVFSGSATANLTITAATTDMNANQYQCVISGFCSPSITTLPATLNVDPMAAASIKISASQTAICAGTSVQFTAADSIGGTNPTHQWKVNGLNAGTNSPFFSTATLANNDVVTCALTSNSTCATVPANAVSNAITILVNSALNISANPSNASICDGGNTSFTVAATGTGLTYQWQQKTGSAAFAIISDGVLFSGTSTATLTVSKANFSMNGYQYQCAFGSTCASASATLTVNPNTIPAISITASQTTICSGTGVTFTAVPANGGSNPSYQWKVNGFVVGANNSVYVSNSLSNSDVISCDLTSNGCAEPTKVSSNTIAMVVNTAPSLSTLPTTSTICAGANTTFIAITSGTALSYQWQAKQSNGIFTDILNNSLYSGANTSSLTISGASIGMNLSEYRLTATGTCTPSVTSGSYVLKVNSLGAMSLSISATPVSICPGDNVSFLATPVNGGANPTYQWKVNGVNSGFTSPVYTSTKLLNNDVVSCDVISNNCASNTLATSNLVSISVNALATLTSGPVDQTICEGGNSQFTVNATGSGFQWQVQTGTSAFVNIVNSAIYGGATTATLNITGALLSMSTNKYQCVVNSGSCAFNVTSNASTLIVNSSAAASISISASQGAICSGTRVNFMATPGNGGSAPVYQWKVNGVNVGLNSPNYSSNTLANNDVVSCSIVSNALCALTATASSNIITISVNSTINVSSDAINSTICAGASTSFSVAATGTGITYQWQEKVGSGAFTNISNAGVYSNATTPVLTLTGTTSAMSNNQYQCLLGGTCLASPAVLVVNALTTLAISIAASQTTICTGSTVVFTATATNAGLLPVYQWKVNRVNKGTNSATFTSVDLINSDTVTCVLTSSALCNNVATANSNPVIINVNALQAITNQPVSASGCQASTIKFGLKATGCGLTYQWQEEIGSNSFNISNSAQYSGANTDTLTIIGVTPGLSTNRYHCVVRGVRSVLVSSSVVLTVTPSPVPTIVVASDATSICPAITVNFTSSITNGGTSPVYQWKLNGLLVGTNAATYSNSNLSNTDVVLCYLTSNASCVAPATVSSTAITFTPCPAVCTAPAAPTFTNGSRCDSGTVALSAGGSPGTYNWYAAIKGGTSLGTSAAFVTPIISQTTVYYVTAVSVTGCESSPRTAVTATVNFTPMAPTAINGSRCGPGPVTLAVSQSSGSYKWYASLSDAVELATTASFTTPSITANTTYYASAVNASCGTSLSRTAVTAYVSDCSDAMLSTTISGNSYRVIAGQIYFVYQEEYNSGVLKFNVYDMQRMKVNVNLFNVLAPSISPAQKAYGYNRFFIQVPQSIASGLYTLEIVNDKNEILQLKFEN